MKAIATDVEGHEPGLLLREWRIIMSDRNTGRNLIRYSPGSGGATRQRIFPEWPQTLMSDQDSDLQSDISKSNPVLPNSPKLKESVPFLQSPRIMSYAGKLVSQNRPLWTGIDENAQIPIALHHQLQNRVPNRAISYSIPALRSPFERVELFLTLWHDYWRFLRTQHVRNHLTPCVTIVYQCFSTALQKILVSLSRIKSISTPWVG